MGINGACRCQELYAMKVGDVRDLHTSFLVTIPTRKVKIKREFAITGNFYGIVKKYIDLRPSQLRSDCFFLNYQKGKCTAQRVGINKFSAMGKQIAMFLNKPNPETYSGLTFCKSSVTLHHTGGNMSAVRPQGDWGFVDDRTQNRNIVPKRTTENQLPSVPAISFVNCSNVTINFFISETK